MVQMAKLRPASEEEMANWDNLIVANPDGGHFLQSKAWGEFRATRGYTTHYLIFEDGADSVATLALERSVKGFGPFWFFSKGPGVIDLKQFEHFTEALHQARPEAFLARLEPQVLKDTANPVTLAKMGLNAAKQQILKATIVVDISPEEETLIAGFKQKTRYNIRLAARKGVTVQAVEPTDANLNQMYDLMHATQERAGYFLHTRDYFMDLWKRFAAAGEGQLFFASFEGQVLAGVYAVYMGRKSWYKDGGSVREHTNVMAPYLLQWEVMRWLKQKGVTSYDMVGVTPRDQVGHHILDSLEHFKMGFSQDIVEWIGTWNLPLSSKYKLWVMGGERLAVAYHGRIKKEFIY